MNIEEIRKNAPEGATMYDDENWTAVTYFKKIEDKWYWRNNTWVLNWTEYDMLFYTEDEFIKARKPLF